jgi:hypothetical protein
MNRNGISTGKLGMLLGIGCAVILACAGDASAYRISLPPNISLAIGDQHELGRAQPPVPAGDADITQYVNFMIGLSIGGSGNVIIGPHTIQVTRSMNDFGPLSAPAILALRGAGTTIGLGTQGTYNYLFTHYAGPGGGIAEVWYVGNLSGIITIPAIGFGHGLSGWALFTVNGRVPEAGASVMLLGLALGALGMSRRFLKR